MDGAQKASTRSRMTIAYAPPLYFFFKSTVTLAEHITTRIFHYSFTKDRKMTKLLTKVINWIGAENSARMGLHLDFPFNSIGVPCPRSLQ